MTPIDENDCCEFSKQMIDVVKDNLKTEIQNKLLQKIIERAAELGYDQNYLNLAHQHLKVIRDSWQTSETGKCEFRSVDESMQLVNSFFFLGKDYLFSSKGSLPVEIDNADPIKILPLEMMLPSDDETRNSYQNELTKYDILFGEVVNTNFMMRNTEFIQLRVICKVGYDRIMYSLGINVYMFKSNEAIRLGEVQLSEVLKVVIIGDFGKNFLFATTKTFLLNDPESDQVSLGRRPVEELPFHLNCIREARKYQSYAQYLKAQPSFHCHQLKERIQSIGVDPYRIYSCAKDRDGLSYPPSSCIESLKEQAQLEMQKDSREHLTEAEKCMKEGDIMNALSSFDEALKCWPQNYRAYELRGKMYSDMFWSKQPEAVKKAMLDFETALKLNPNAQVAKEEYSKIFAYVGNKFRKQKKCGKSKEIAEMSLKIFKDNQIGKKVLRRLEGSKKRKRKD